MRCLANYICNRASGIEDIPRIGSTPLSPVVVQHYQKITSAWSHTFANTEMSEDSPVDVEIGCRPDACLISDG